MNGMHRTQSDYELFDLRSRETYARKYSTCKGKGFSVGYHFDLKRKAGALSTAAVTLYVFL